MILAVKEARHKPHYYDVVSQPMEIGASVLRSGERTSLLTSDVRQPKEPPVDEVGKAELSNYTRKKERHCPDERACRPL